MVETRRTAASKPPPRHSNHGTNYQLNCLNYASLRSDSNTLQRLEQSGHWYSPSHSAGRKGIAGFLSRGTKLPGLNHGSKGVIWVMTLHQQEQAEASQPPPVGGQHHAPTCLFDERAA